MTHRLSHWQARLSGMAALLLLTLAAGCRHEQTWIADPNLLSPRGLAMGSSKQSVFQEFGQPGSEFTFRKNGRLIAVVEYDSFELDYRPAYGDDMGVLPPRSGVQSQYRRDYRLVFIDNQLCSIEDFKRSRYWAVSDPEATVLLEQLQRNE